MRHPTVLLALCGLMLVGGQALAEKRPNYTQARKAFTAGIAALKANMLVEAVQRFEKAYEISGDAKVMGYAALAHERAGRYLQAAEALKIYRKAVPKAERSQIDRLIARFKKAHANIADELEPEDETPPEPERQRFWTWIAAGGTVLLAATATTLAVSAQSSYDSLEATCSPGCPAGEADSVKGRAIAADVFFGLTLGGAIGTAVLYYLEGRNTSAEKEKEKEKKTPGKEVGLQIRPGPGSIGLRLTF